MESFGARLKHERERQKITLDDVAIATKIGTRMLKALEEEQFDQLPGGIFNKGFVRAYARHLGIDEEQAVADYLAATGPAEPIREPETVLNALAVRADESRNLKEPGTDDLPWDKLAIVLLIVALGFAIWGWRNRKQNHAAFGQPSSAAVADSAVAAPAPPAAQPPASGDATPAATGPATSPADTTPAPTEPAASNPTMSSPAPQSVSPSPQAQDQVAPPVPAGAFLLLIHAHDDSWLDVTADGKDIAHELLPAGAQRYVEAQREIVVKAGNVGGLELTFNGKKLPPQGAPDEVKTLRFDSGGLQVSAVGPHPLANPS